MLLLDRTGPFVLVIRVKVRFDQTCQQHLKKNSYMAQFNLILRLLCVGRVHGFDPAFEPGSKPLVDHVTESLYSASAIKFIHFINHQPENGINL